MTDFIPSLDGTRIPVISTIPNTSRSPIVHVLLHGLGTSKDEYLEFYAQLAARFAAAGQSSVRFDFRAHGESAEPEPSFTPVNCLIDAVAVVKHVASTFPRHEIRLFGTSFGASIALLAANVLGRRIERLSLLSPVLDYNRLYIHPADRSRRERFGGMLEHTGIRGEPHVATDELNFHQRAVLEMSAISLPAAIERIAARVEVMHGRADKAVPFAETRRAMRFFRRARLTAFPRMEHGFTKAGDETGTDPETQANLRKIVEIAVS